MNVVLRGGPAAHFADAERILYVPDTENSFKLQRGNRYEHFEPTAETVRHEGRNCWCSPGPA
ncbi:DUF5988 family protein [Streptomyces sp. M19]